jgi:hypothetical protein
LARDVIPRLLAQLDRAERALLDVTEFSERKLSAFEDSLADLRAQLAMKKREIERLRHVLAYDFKTGGDDLEALLQRHSIR